MSASVKKRLRVMGAWVVSAFGVASAAVSDPSTIHLPPAVSAVLVALGPGITLLEHYVQKNSVVEELQTTLAAARNALDGAKAAVTDARAQLSAARSAADSALTAARAPTAVPGVQAAPGTKPIAEMTDAEKDAELANLRTLTVPPTTAPPGG